MASLENNCPLQSLTVGFPEDFHERNGSYNSGQNNINIPLLLIFKKNICHISLCDKPSMYVHSNFINTYFIPKNVHTNTHGCIIKYVIVGIDKECMECNIFARLETHLTIGFS